MYWCFRLREGDFTPNKNISDTSHLGFMLYSGIVCFYFTCCGIFRFLKGGGSDAQLVERP